MFGFELTSSFDDAYTYFVKHGTCVLEYFRSRATDLTLGFGDFHWKLKVSGSSPAASYVQR